MGDFNTFLHKDDKQGGCPPNLLEMATFLLCLEDCGLVQIPHVGDMITWEKKGVRERLDWAFENFDWEIKHPLHKVFHDLHFKSDHRVLVVKTSNLKPPSPISKILDTRQHGELRRTLNS